MAINDRIMISFKNNEEEKELYKWITSHSNYSGFVKDILKKEMSKLEDKAEKPAEEVIEKRSLLQF